MDGREFSSSQQNPRALRCSSNMLEPCTYELTSGSQLRNFRAQASALFPKLKEKKKFFIRQNKIGEAMSKDPKREGVGGRKVPTYQSQRQLQHQSSNQISSRWKFWLPFKSGDSTVYLTHCALSLTKPILELCLHRSHRARKHSFSHFANNAPLAVVSEMRTTPRQ